MHKVVDMSNHVMAPMVPALPYIGLDKDGMFLGLVENAANGAQYTSFPVNLQQLNKLILCAEVARSMILLKQYFAEYDWDKLYIYNTINRDENMFVIFVEHKNSKYTNDTEIDGMVVYTHNKKDHLCGGLKRFFRTKVEPWIPFDEMNPMAAYKRE